MKNYLSGLFVATVMFCATTSQAQNIPSPKDHFGFNIGDDYTLATYTQTEAYFKKLAVSERTKLVDIGLTEEGRHQYMLIVSSPENIKNLARYKEISQKLARAEGLTDDQARKLADEGKSVVWIDGGLHATEVVGTHQLIETAWQLVTRNDKETLDILSNTIVLLVPANPDGQELVSSWYMKDSDPLKRKTNIPRLYQKYVGHDNNRDFFMNSMKESINMSRQLYIEWMPQILYNHHQSGPAGTVLAGPPFRDPFNYVFDPLVVTTLDAVGAAMVSRLITEGKPGYTAKNGSSYSTWYNGGLRTTAYFHNMTGLLTEIIGSPTPSEIPLVIDRLLPSGATPYPITPQQWHFRQSIDYSVSLNYAVMDYASRQRNEVLYNIYRMGMNSIQRGSNDYWTVSPKAIEAIKTASNTDRAAGNTTNARPGGPGGNTGRSNLKYYEQVLRDPARRDPRAYILPSDQEDFPTAVRFVNALILSGIQIHKATSPFTVNGKNYPAGSFVIRTSQAFRPHVIDLFEPQDHPNDFQYPGGPPIAPYDAAGWTLAFQMGVKFDRILNNLEGTFQAIPYGEVQSFTKETIATGAKAGYLLSPLVNNSFIVVNDLLKSGVQVYRLPDGAASSTNPGTFFIPSSSKAQTILAKSAAENGVVVKGIDQRPAGAVRLLPARIAIFNRYGGSMPAGWMSWVFEQYHFPYEMIYPQMIDAGNLRKKFDVIIFTGGAFPSARRGTDTVSTPMRQPNYEGVPPEYQSWIGSLTAEKSIPQLKRFLDEGGTIITTETSTSLATLLKIPVKNAMVKTNTSGQETQLSRTEYYIPGSLLTADINTDEPSNWGMPSKADFYFDGSPVFKLDQDAEIKGVKVLAWFSTETPMHSGWAVGQKYLKDGIIAFEAPVGAGKLYAFGTDITFRSQPHGIFKLLFNQLYQINLNKTPIGKK